MSQMSSPRTAQMVAAAVLVAGISFVAGCANQPVGPSRFSLTRSAEAASAASVAPGADGVVAAPSRFGTRTPGVVYVTSQRLYYDTFVVKDPLPMEGRFQLIANGATEFGPGQPGYLGGRWWEDVNSNGIQDPDDHYFLCPLLPPGRPTP